MIQLSCLLVILVFPIGSKVWRIWDCSLLLLSSAYSTCIAACLFQASIIQHNKKPYRFIWNDFALNFCCWREVSKTGFGFACSLALMLFSCRSVLLFLWCPSALLHGSCWVEVVSLFW